MCRRTLLLRATIQINVLVLLLYSNVDCLTHDGTCQHGVIMKRDEGPPPLGMENLKIPSSRISASSTYENYVTPQHSRLNSESGWAPKVVDDTQWLQVDFFQYVTLAIVSIKPRHNWVQYVSSFAISYSDDGATFAFYQEDGQNAILAGNSDSVNTVNQTLLSPIVARFVRIHPKTWEGHPTMRVEFYGWYQNPEGPQPLGMENSDIPLTWLSSSSVLVSTRKPTDGRLRGTPYDGAAMWCPGLDDANPWLQVDFHQDVILANISIQTRRTGSQVYVTSYSVSYSDDGVNFEFYQQNGDAAVFPGNYDNIAIVDQALSPMIRCRFIRVHPKTWFVTCCARFEFHGWYEGSRPLGMENLKIGNSQIKHSSKASGSWVGRCNRQSTWVAVESDDNKWIQVDFLQYVTLLNISTQGSHFNDDHVTSFIVSYSGDDKHYRFYRNNGQIVELQGNVDANTVVTHAFSPIIIARYVKVHPKTWHTAIGFRVEFHGWYGVTSHTNSYFECSHRCVATNCTRLAYRPAQSLSDKNCRLANEKRSSWFDMAGNDWLYAGPASTSCAADNQCVLPSKCVVTSCEKLGYKCVCDEHVSGKFCEVKRIHVKLTAVGYLDPGFTTTLQSCMIEINGVDESRHGRGVSIVVIDEASGLVVSSARFDMSISGSANDMAAFLDALSPRHIVLAVTWGDPSYHMNAKGLASLASIGALLPSTIQYRSSFAVIGYTGSEKPSYVSQVYNNKGDGPSIIDEYIHITLKPQQDS